MFTPERNAILVFVFHDLQIGRISGPWNFEIRKAVCQHKALTNLWYNGYLKAFSYFFGFFFLL
jgi:hypothetical protein